MSSEKKHKIAIAQALLVTFLWSTSFVLVKIGLEEVPPVTFAGMRYAIAATVLLLYIVLTGRLKEFKQINRSQWLRLIILGLVMYFVTQGAQYLGLYYLSAIQVSLFLNFTPVIILVFSTRFIGEKPTRNNIIGVIIFLCGMLIYFLPLTETGGVITGYIVMTIGLLANAIATMLGRKVNMERQVSPVIVTTISMAIGGFLLLGTGVATETITTISINYVLLTVLLAVLNTAFAFSLWNKTMQVLTSVESSIINNTMLVQIAILSWLFLDEKFTLKAVTGIIVVSIGVFLVQYRKKNVAKTDTESISLEELKP